MIKNDLYWQYDNKVTRNDPRYNDSESIAPCWHCLESIHYDETTMAIVQEGYVSDGDTKELIEMKLFFHVECFKKIAGTEYIVDVPQDGLRL